VLATFDCDNETWGELIATNKIIEGQLLEFAQQGRVYLYGPVESRR